MLAANKIPKAMAIDAAMNRKEVNLVPGKSFSFGLKISFIFSLMLILFFYFSLSRPLKITQVLDLMQNANCKNQNENLKI